MAEHKVVVLVEVIMGVSIVVAASQDSGVIVP